jgi:fructokinase
MIHSRVLCLGEILFDCLADQPGRELAAVESWTPYPGGAPANVACGLVKLETTAGFIGCVGRDKPGDDLVNLLAEIGVNTAGIQRHASAPTRQVYVTRSLSGDRHFAGFGDRDTAEFADTHLAAEQLPESLFATADYLVTGTLELAYTKSRKAIARALELAKQYGVKVAIDINWRPVFWHDLDAAPPLIWEIIQQADLIKCSDDEAQWLFKTDNPKDILQLPEFKAVKGVLVTAGEKGCKYCLGKSEGEVSVFKIDVIDTTGAGDSFLAGFLHQCCQQGEEIFQNVAVARKAVVYASAAGALTTTKPGAIAAQPTAAEIETFLASHSL